MLDPHGEQDLPDVGIINVNILDECLLGLRKILEDDTEQFHRDLLVGPDITNEFIERHLTKIEIYHEVLSIETSNQTIASVATAFLKTEERKLIEMLSSTFIMAAMLESRRLEAEGRPKLGTPSNGGSLLNKLNLRNKSFIVENYEADYMYLITLSRNLLHRVSDVSTAVELTSKALSVLTDTLPHIRNDISSAFNLILIYFEQCISVLSRLIAADSTSLLSLLDYFLSDA